jgi:hypothetical protein
MPNHDKSKELFAQREQQYRRVFDSIPLTEVTAASDLLILLEAPPKCGLNDQMLSKIGKIRRIVIRALRAFGFTYGQISSLMEISRDSVSRIDKHARRLISIGAIVRGSDELYFDAVLWCVENHELVIKGVNSRLGESGVTLSNVG